MIPKYKTNISIHEGFTKVKLWDTIIVSFNTNQIILNTGGHWTQTTKNRMNQASKQFSLNYKISSINGQWFVTTESTIVPFGPSPVLILMR